MIAESGLAQDLSHLLESRRKKAPAAAGALSELKYLSAAVADHFDFDAAIFSAAFGSSVARNGLALAFALSEDAISRYALGHEERFDSIGAAHRQLEIVGVGACPVSVPGCNDHFNIGTFEFRYQILEFGLARRFQHGFVEIEEGVCLESDFF